MAVMQTYSGARVNPLAPEVVTPLDVAYHLAGINRYTGASKVLYSVAQHSVDVMHRLHPAYHSSNRAGITPNREELILMLQGLTHDAHEAYFGDISAPMKHALGGILKPIEDACQTHVLTALGVPLPLPPEVKEADDDAFHSEYPALWSEEAMDRLSVQPWGRDEAATTWLYHYYRLTAEIRRLS